MDLMSVCRTCMSSSSLNPIFPLPEVHEKFSDAIYLITGIKVTLEDGLPQKMCIECLKQVNDAMKFRAKCKETEETLLKIKTEVRRAVRHNERIVNYRNDFIREIKVGNRWIKINPTNNAMLENHQEENIVDDEQPLMQLLNADPNDIQNIYITDETGEQMIPLEMLKIEMESRNANANYTEEDSVMNPEDANETVYDVNNLQDTTEDAINEHEDINNQEMVHEQEDTFENPEEAVEEEPEYTIINIQGNVNDEEITAEEQEVTYEDPGETIDETGETIVVNQEVAVNDPEDTFNDPEVSDSLKTYYIYKDNEFCPDTVTSIKKESNSYVYKDNEFCPDTLASVKKEPNPTDNTEFDNINISENQDIVVMDNRESLYVIDMSNPSSKRVTCKLCQKNLSIRSIDLHLSKCHPGADGRRVKCELCDNFVIREKMVQHRLVMHGADAFQCRYCKWEFEKEDALIEHVVTCNAKKKRKASEMGRQLVECEVCHKSMQKASLRLHTAMTHAGLRPVCAHCGKSFGNKFRLSEHCRAKHGYEKFKCSYCEFQSASSMALRNHERRHRGEKPYVCERCGAKFHAAYLLTQHKQSHRTERNFKCEICGMTFKTNNGLHSHRRTCHSGSRRTRSGRVLDGVTDAQSEINDV